MIAELDRGSESTPVTIGSDNDLFLTVLAPRGFTLYLINPPPRRWTGTPSDMAKLRPR